MYSIYLVLVPTFIIKKEDVREKGPRSWTRHFHTSGLHYHRPFYDRLSCAWEVRAH